MTRIQNGLACKTPLALPGQNQAKAGHPEWERQDASLLQPDTLRRHLFKPIKYSRYKSHCGDLIFISINHILSNAQVSVGANL